LDFGETKSIKEMARQDRDHVRQRINSLARKINTEIVSEVKRFQFQKKDMEMEEAYLSNHEKSIEIFNLRFSGNNSGDLLRRKKMELDMIRLRLKYQEKLYLYETQKLKLQLILGILVKKEVESSISDEIIEFWQKG
jgi:hypothetical protein